MEGSWGNVPSDVLTHIYQACVALDQGTVWDLKFLLTCKNWRKQAGLFITKLRLSEQGPGQLRSALTGYPHLQSLHLHRVSLYFSQFEDIGKLPNLRHLSLVHLKSAEKANQLLLQEDSVARRSAFQFLQKLTSLELGAHKQAPVTPEEYEGISHLTDLQHITLQRRPFSVPTSGYIPVSILLKLSALTSLEVHRVEHGISQLTRLQNLSLLSGGPYQFTEDFSSLQGLTALAVGWGRQQRNDALMGLCDLKSLKVFSSLQKLILKGTMGAPVEGHFAQTTLWSLWEGLATLTSVKHLDVGDILYTKDAFKSLAKMTQLTCLNFSFKSHVHADFVDAQLAALSTLTSLDVLRCQFFCYPCQIVWSPQDKKYVAGPMPTVGIGLKAALPQAASMSVFAIEPRA